MVMNTKFQMADKVTYIDQEVTHTNQADMTTPEAYFVAGAPFPFPIFVAPGVKSLQFPYDLVRRSQSG